jgi:hypothetical protein
MKKIKLAILLTLLSMMLTSCTGELKEEDGAGDSGLIFLVKHLNPISSAHAAPPEFNVENLTHVTTRPINEQLAKALFIHAADGVPASEADKHKLNAFAANYTKYLDDEVKARRVSDQEFQRYKEDSKMFKASAFTIKKQLDYLNAVTYKRAFTIEVLGEITDLNNIVNIRLICGDKKYLYFSPRPESGKIEIQKIPSNCKSNAIASVESAQVSSVHSLDKISGIQEVDASGASYGVLLYNEMKNSSVNAYSLNSLLGEISKSVEKVGKIENFKEHINLIYNKMNETFSNSGVSKLDKAFTRKCINEINYYLVEDEGEDPLLQSYLLADPDKLKQLINSQCSSIMSDAKDAANGVVAVTLSASQSYIQDFMLENFRSTELKDIDKCIEAMNVDIKDDGYVSLAELLKNSKQDVAKGYYYNGYSECKLQSLNSTIRSAMKDKGYGKYGVSDAKSCISGLDAKLSSKGKDTVTKLASMDKLDQVIDPFGEYNCGED